MAILHKKRIRLKKNNGIKGFTLIEVIAILVIIGIVSVIVISKMGSTDDYKLVSEVETLKNHLRFAQIRSMSSLCKERWGVRINKSSYDLLRKGGADLVNLPGEDSTTHTLQSGVTITSGSGSIIGFDDFGCPVDNAGNPIADDFTITVNSSNNSRSLTITRETGFIQ